MNNWQKIKDRVSIYKFWFDIGAGWLTAPLVFVTLATLLYERISLFRQIYFPYFFMITLILGGFIFVIVGRILSKLMLKKYYEYASLRNPFTAEKLTPKEILTWKVSIINSRLSLKFLEGQGVVSKEEKELLTKYLNDMEKWCNSYG
jgi:hypothetical protein